MSQRFLIVAMLALCIGCKKKDVHILEHFKICGTVKDFKTGEGIPNIPVVIMLHTSSAGWFSSSESDTLARLITDANGQYALSPKYYSKARNEKYYYGVTLQLPPDQYFCNTYHSFPFRELDTLPNRCNNYDFTVAPFGLLKVLFRPKFGHTASTQLNIYGYTAGNPAGWRWADFLYTNTPNRFHTDGFSNLILTGNQQGTFAVFRTLGDDTVTMGSYIRSSGNSVWGDVTFESHYTPRHDTTEVSFLY